MEVTFKLQVFEGPLDLLLHLVTANKVRIDDIPIADILRQYLEYLEQLRSLNIEVTSDFIVMAAQLIYIKSRMLLPKDEDPNAEDPRLSLARRLEEYKLFKETAVKLKEREFLGRELMVKPPETIEQDPIYRGRHEGRELVSALLSMELVKPKPEAPLKAFSGIVGHVTVSIEEQAEAVLKKLSVLGNARLMDFFAGVRDRSTAVAVFLAILDLTRHNKITLGEDDLITMGGPTE